MMGGALAWPLAAQAQQANRMRRIAVLTNVTDTDVDERGRLAAFGEELRRLGWIEKNNVQVEYRWTAARSDLLLRFSAEIVASKPDVIFVIGTTTVSTILKHTRSIPVVFVTGADPVQVGFVKSMANPGGNATGVADFEDSIGAKWLQLLEEIVPKLRRAIFLHTDSRATLIQLPALQQLAVTMNISVIPAKVGSADEIERALGAYAGQTDIGLIVPSSSLLGVHREAVLTRAAQYRLPAIYANRRFVAEGGLMSYGIDRVEQYRRVASYADRILKGANPGELPVRQSEKFELVFNLKTAKALGLNVPRILLARTDEIIE